MRLYILRHGDAEDPSRRNSDEERELTSEGRHEVQNVMRAAAKAKADADLIVASPLVRAVQTAELAAGELGYKERIAQTRALIPSSSPEAVWEEIRNHAEVDHLLLVGHEPLLSGTVAFLLNAPNAGVKMTTGALVCLEIDGKQRRPQGILRWMLTPKLAKAVE